MEPLALRRLAGRPGLPFPGLYIKAVWKALLLSLALGAGVQVLVPHGVVRYLFVGCGATIRAAGAALPSMMCTCCAAPVAVGMI